MAKIDRLFNRVKSNIQEFGMEAKRAVVNGVRWLGTEEGKYLITGIQYGIIIGAIVVRRQDAKALGLSTKELVNKVKDYRKNNK